MHHGFHCLIYVCWQHLIVSSDFYHNVPGSCCGEFWFVCFHCILDILGITLGDSRPYWIILLELALILFRFSIQFQATFADCGSKNSLILRVLSLLFWSPWFLSCSWNSPCPWRSSPIGQKGFPFAGSVGASGWRRRVSVPLRTEIISQARSPRRDAWPPGVSVGEGNLHCLEQEPTCPGSWFLAWLRVNSPCQHCWVYLRLSAGLLLDSREHVPPRATLSWEFGLGEMLALVTFCSWVEVSKMPCHGVVSVVLGFLNSWTFSLHFRVIL